MGKREFAEEGHASDIVLYFLEMRSSIKDFFPHKRFEAAIKKPVYGPAGYSCDVKTVSKETWGAGECALPPSPRRGEGRGSRLRG